MTSTIQFILGSLITVLLLTAITIGTWAALRTGKTAQTLKNFRDAADSWEATAGAQSAELTQVKAQLSEALARIAVQDAKIAVMQELITGTKAMELLASQMAELRREVLAEFRLTREMILKGAG